MFSIPTFSNPFRFPQIVRTDLNTAIDIKSVEIHNVENSFDKRARSLKHLLRLNHVNHSIIYHDLKFDNHMPHILASAFILGASSAHLETIYERESKDLEKWKHSPGEVSKHDWRDYLGDRRFQRAFLDYFEDELVTNGYEWRKVLNEYFFSGKEPLINCVIAGCHPLIHLGYAYELSSREIGMEALSLAAASYNSLHRYIDDASYTQSSSFSSSSLLEILENVSNDSGLFGLFDHPGGDNMEVLFKDHEEIVLEHWNAWKVSNPKKQFEESQRAAVALLVATQQPADDCRYDFFLVHLLTMSHAVRILIPLIPAKHHISLVRQWWLISLAIYIAQLRPPIKVDGLLNYDTEGKAWDWVDEQAVSSRWATDAHYVKGLRAMKEAAQTWGDEDRFYLKAAIKFALEFCGWGGFGPSNSVEVN